MRNSSLLKWAQNNKTSKQGSVKNKDEKGKKYNCPEMSNLTHFTLRKIYRKNDQYLSF